MKHGKHSKVEKVMGEFKRGTLRSGSGAKVKKRSQAVAIAMSEAGLSRKKHKRVRGAGHQGSPFEHADTPHYGVRGKMGILSS